MSGNEPIQTSAPDAPGSENDDQTLIPPDGMDVMPDDGLAGSDEPQFELPSREQPDPESLLRELEEHRRKAAEHLDLALRAQAELDNARKRVARDIENAHKFALERFINELLPVIDSMELGLNAAGNGTETASLREGLELTLRMFVAAMEKFGVKAIAPEGGKFNPELHQAVSMLEQPGLPSGTVISVMQKGYELNGRLVRPAMVVVAK